MLNWDQEKMIYTQRIPFELLSLPPTFPQSYQHRKFVKEWNWKMWLFISKFLHSAWDFVILVVIVLTIIIIYQLGRGSKKSRHLKWHLPLSVGPLPPMAQISRHFFTPLFFFCNWILHIWNGFYTSKILLLSPLIIGSKLTFRPLTANYLATFKVTSTTIFT